MRNFLDDGIAEHKSYPPLRWIANWAGARASSAIMRAAWLDEYGIHDGIRHTINEKIFKYLWPVYKKYGTWYRMKMDLSGPGWNDYDENGVPYWEQWHWDFIDEETGDAFKLINFGGKE